MCEGFAAGLNYYVDRHPATVPDWMPRVTGHDVAAYGLAGVMRFAFNRSDLLKDFLKAQGVATAMLDDAPDDDSRSARTCGPWPPAAAQSGRALLMGNPHQPWAPVSTYYEAHMIVPGKLNFYGSTFIGRPILTSGWNEYLGWSHTVNYPDLEEIYEAAISIRAAGPLPVRRRLGAAGARRCGDSRSKRTTALRTDTRNLLAHAAWARSSIARPSKVYVLRSACYENYRAYEQWLRMTQTKNFAEFRHVLEMNAMPMFNICYADRVGNIFYLWNGTVPEPAASGPQGRSRACRALERRFGRDFTRSTSCRSCSIRRAATCRTAIRRRT